MWLIADEAVDLVDLRRSEILLSARLMSMTDGIRRGNQPDGISSEAFAITANPPSGTDREAEG